MYGHKDPDYVLVSGWETNRDGATSELSFQKGRFLPQRSGRASELRLLILTWGKLSKLSHFWRKPQWTMLKFPCVLLILASYSFLWHRDFTLSCSLSLNIIAVPCCSQPFSSVQCQYCISCLHRSFWTSLAATLRKSVQYCK